MRVRDREVVVAAGQREPFGVFAFVPPSRMFEAELVGFDATGRSVARADVPRALLPVE